MGLDLKSLYRGGGEPEHTWHCSRVSTDSGVTPGGCSGGHIWYRGIEPWFATFKENALNSALFFLAIKGHWF